MKYRLWIVGAIAAVLVLVGGGLAYAGQSGEQPPKNVRAAEKDWPGGLAGQVIQVGDESLTIETRDGEVEVSITEETTFRVPGIQEATLADIEAGAAVLIRTRADEDGTLTALAVVVRPPRRIQENFVRGAVTEVNDGEILVETAEGEIATVFTSEKTRLWVPGEPLTTTLTLEVGDPLLALGAPASIDADGKALSALLLVVVSDGDLPKVVIQGKALAITQQTIVVQTGRGERAITVLPRTQLRSASGKLDSVHDIGQGTQIIALGQPTEMGQWVAGLVLIPGPEPLARNGLRGEVLSKDSEAGTLSVETEQRGEITVVTGEDTRYRIPDVEEPGFADVKVGDRVVAVGRFEEGSETIFLAQVVGIQPPTDREEKP